jgi:hypothetical protein
MNGIYWHDTIQSLIRETHKNEYESYRREWTEIVILDYWFVDVNDRIIFVWLKENVGDHDSDWQVFYEKDTALFRFKTPEARMLFALRWII